MAEVATAGREPRRCRPPGPGRAGSPGRPRRAAVGGRAAVRRLRRARARRCRRSRSPSRRSRTPTPTRRRSATSTPPSTAPTATGLKNSIELSLVMRDRAGHLRAAHRVRDLHREARQRAAPGRRSRHLASSPTSAASRWRSCSSRRSARPGSSPAGSTSGSTSGTTASTCTTFKGIFVVYLYFQIPLMVLVILPALEGLRPAWREAAQNMGAGTWQYWRYVGGPVLFPSFLGCLLLLFGSCLLGVRHGRGPDRRHRRADSDPDRRAAERQRHRRPGESRLRPRPDHDRHHRDRHDSLHDPAAEGRQMAAIASVEQAGTRRRHPRPRRPPQAQLPGLALGDPADRGRLLPDTAVRRR